MNTDELAISNKFLVTIHTVEITKQKLPDRFVHGPLKYY